MAHDTARPAAPRRVHWNKENRFTGWTDVDLTEKGREEARVAGQLIKKPGSTSI